VWIAQKIKSFLISASSDVDRSWHPV
jgi:hypothetical protein